MYVSRTLEQHVAVFGESGSGKTVMLSAFYGASQEPRFLRSSPFDITADDPGQGHRLHRNYLGMRDSGRRPEPTRFSSTAYAFSVKLRDRSAKAAANGQVDALRLVWHDYPGEWFEQDVSGPEESQRRIETFRSLLGSDLAILLIDGQLVLDNRGEEERYLKSVIGSFRQGLVRLRDDLIGDGAPIARFPRIWILALSKADLLPELDVYGFRDLVIGRASDDLDELRRVLGSLVDSSEALAVGEDFLLLSSARFETNKIEVAERIGLDLILPLAAILPFERHIQWVGERQLGARAVEELLKGAGPLAAMILGKAAGPVSKLIDKIGRESMTAAMNRAAELVGDKLRQRNAQALANRDEMAAVLTGFKLDLENSEEAGVFLRSRR